MWVGKMNGKAGEVYRKKTYGSITNDETSHWILKEWYTDTALGNESSAPHFEKQLFWTHEARNYLNNIENFPSTFALYRPVDERTSGK